MAEKKPSKKLESILIASDDVDDENNISVTPTDILTAGTPSATQLSSYSGYSDYSCFITPSYHNPNALLFDKTLPGLTQGKRLTSTSATLSVHASAHDRKPSKEINLIKNGPVTSNDVAKALNRIFTNSQRHVDDKTANIIGDYASRNQFQRLKRSPPSSDYKNQNIGAHAADSPGKRVKKRRSEESNNNNSKRHNSKSSINSKVSESSQFFYHRNFRGLPPVQEDPENLPKVTVIVAAGSSSSSGGDDGKKSAKTKKKSTGCLSFLNSDSDEETPANKASQPVSAKPATQGAPHHETKKSETAPSEHAHHHGHSHTQHPPSNHHHHESHPPQKVVTQPSNATTESAKTKKKSTGCLSFLNSDSDEETKANKAAQPVSAKPATQDAPHHETKKSETAPNEQAHHHGHSHNQHPPSHGHHHHPPSQVHSQAHPSEHPRVQFSPSTKTAATPPRNLNNNPSVPTTHHVHHHPLPAKKSVDSESEEESSEEESEETPKNKKARENSDSTRSSKKTSSGSGSTKKTGTTKTTQSNASSSAGAGGNGGGGKKSNDDHHSSSKVSSSSSEESSEMNSSSSEDEHSHEHHSHQPHHHPHHPHHPPDHPHHHPHHPPHHPHHPPHHPHHPHPHPPAHSNHSSAHSIHSHQNAKHPVRPVVSAHSQPTSRCSSNHEIHRRPVSQTSIPRTTSNHQRPQEGYRSAGAMRRPEHASYSENYHHNNTYIPPVGSTRYGTPWPNIPIVDKNSEFYDKGINFDVTQQYVPPGGRPHANQMNSSFRRASCDDEGVVNGGRTSHGGAPMYDRGSYTLNKKRSSTLDVSINRKHHGSSTIYAGEGVGGDGRASAGHPEYPYYQGYHPQNGPHTFVPHGAGTPIRKQFSDHPSNVNIHIRKNGNDGYDDMGQNDPGPYNNDGIPLNDNDYNGNGNGYGNENGYGNGNGNGNGYGAGNGNGNMPNCPCPTFIPMPIPFPMSCPCPPQCPPPPPCPPPCCCPKRRHKKKKKKKNKDCGKQWDMMSMYGMYTLFQQMFSSWQNQMTEQYERSRPKPPPPQQYAVVMTNPCQAMAMMGGNGCSPPMMMMPGLGSCVGPMSGRYSGGEPNPIFEVTGVEVRGDANETYKSN